MELFFLRLRTSFINPKANIKLKTLGPARHMLKMLVIKVDGCSYFPFPLRPLPFIKMYLIFIDFIDVIYNLPLNMLDSEILFDFTVSIS